MQLEVPNAPPAPLAPPAPPAPVVPAPAGVDHAQQVSIVQVQQAELLLQDLGAARAAHPLEMVDQAFAFFSATLLRAGPTPPFLRALQKFYTPPRQPRSAVPITTRQAAGAAIANIYLAIRVLSIAHGVPHQGNCVAIFRHILEVGNNCHEREGLGKKCCELVYAVVASSVQNWLIAHTLVLGHEVGLEAIMPLVNNSAWHAAIICRGVRLRCLEDDEIQLVGQTSAWAGSLNLLLVLRCI